MKDETSVVRYKPIHTSDYGTLLCWAQSNLTTQKTPCMFQIMPAGKVNI